MAKLPSRLRISPTGIPAWALEVSADLRYARFRPSPRSGLATRDREQRQDQGEFRPRTRGGDVHQATYCA